MRMAARFEDYERYCRKRVVQLPIWDLHNLPISEAKTCHRPNAVSTPQFVRELSFPISYGAKTTRFRRRAFAPDTAGNPIFLLLCGSRLGDCQLGDVNCAIKLRWAMMAGVLNRQWCGIIEDEKLGDMDEA